MAAITIINEANFAVGASTAVTPLVGGGQITWSITPSGTFKKKGSGTPTLTGVGINGPGPTRTTRSTSARC
ncbi:MAG: hypothetical protein RML45_15810 [Acetobacteraceae bacterium]|nr:hypothetical protein [Acetobacteraceae bacterium]